MFQLRDDGTLRERLSMERQGKAVKCTEKKGTGTFGRTRRVGDTMDSAGHAARSDTSHQSVNGESLASVRKMQTVEKAEDTLTQKKIEK